MKFPITLIKNQTSFDFIGKRWLGFILSFIAVILTIVSLYTNKLNFGIDFSGGVVMEVRDSVAVDIGKYRVALEKEGFSGVSLQNFGTNQDIMIRFQVKDGSNPQEVINNIKLALEKNFGTQLEYRKIDFVGPQVGSELTKKAFAAVVLSLIGIMIYLWFRFNWQFGIGGLAALVHDAVATVGFYSITRTEFDLTSIAAILTIIGYSINDSVVIYDRIRENLRKYKKRTMQEIINLSVNETLSRTILTAGTTLLACLALIFFGGEVIKGFSMAMFFGILVGTYSSIFISAPILIYTGVKNLNTNES